jgi:hypothetical protein
VAPAQRRQRAVRLADRTTDGYLACLDASATAIRGAEAGKVPKTGEIKAPRPQGVAPSATVETTASAGGDVLVECVEESGRLRIRPASAGCHKDWRVQFPKNIRDKGARYVVDELCEAAQGGFYRAYGEIRKLV